MQLSGPKFGSVTEAPGGITNTRGWVSTSDQLNQNDVLFYSVRGFRCAASTAVIPERPQSGRKLGSRPIGSKSCEPWIHIKREFWVPNY